MNLEEIFTSSNPAGGRMINVISGVAGSDASPYTADNPAGGRAINVNIVGGGVGAGVLQLQSNAPLDTTLRKVADQANTVSPLQLSTTKILMGTSAGSSPQTINIGETNRLGSALYSNTYVVYGDWMELRGNTGIQIPTNNLVVGTTLASARLHVRGDGTNPIFRAESSTGATYFGFDSSGVDLTLYSSTGRFKFYDSNTSISRSSNTLLFTGNYSTTDSSFQFATAGGTINGPLSGTKSFVDLNVGTIALAAGSSNIRPFNIAYTIDNSGVNSGVATGIYLRATETALNSMLHNFIDLGTAAAGSLFSVTNVGAIKVATIADASAPNSSLYFSSTASRLVWKDAAGVVNNLY